VPRRRPVAIPPQQSAEDLPRMHVLFDLMAAFNVSNPFVEELLGDPKLAENYGLLSLIGGAKSITPTAVAARLGVPVTTVSDRLRRLEERGLAERRPNPADGRSHLVSLTDKGRAAFEGSLTTWRETIVRLEEELSVPSRDIAEAIRELDRAMRAILARRAAAPDE
jgi:DNA-binding MarR family transcriptional regulator